MPLMGPTKKGTFRKATLARDWKLAKVPPVMQATRAPARKAMTPWA